MSQSTQAAGQKRHRDELLPAQPPCNAAASPLLQGPFPKKMLRKGAFTAKHFDDDPAMSFKLYEEDPVSRKIVRRTLVV